MSAAFNVFGSKPKVKTAISLSAVAGFAVFLIYLVYFSDSASVANIILRTNLPLYALAFVCVLGGSVVNALTWRSILRSLSVDTPIRRVVSLSWVGTFVDAFIPGGWSGDIFKAYLLSKIQNTAGAKAAASIVVKNILELIVTLGALVTGMILLAFNYNLAAGVILAVCLTLIFLALPLFFVIYFSANIRATKKLLRLAKKLVARIQCKPENATADSESKIQESFGEFHEGIMTIRTNPKAMIKPIILQTAAWALDILTLFLIFASIGTIVGPDKVIITNTIVVNLQSQGMALAGFAQVVSSAVYSILGIAPFVSAASSVLAGFATFWFKLAVSFIAFQMVVLERYVPFVTDKGQDIPSKSSRLPFVRKN